MHVLNVNMNLDAVKGGGTVERTVQMSRHLVRSGVSCTILATDVGWSSTRAKDFEGIEVIALPCWGKRYYIFGPALRRIRDAVVRADVVHFMGHWTLLNALTYLYARRFGKPYVVCPAGALPIFGRSKILKRLYNFVIGRRIVRNAARCIAVTRSELPHFNRYGVSSDRVTVIPNGIDPQAFAAPGDGNLLARIGLGEAPFILFMGRLSLIKGPDLLFRAFAGLGLEFRHHHLVFAGPDDGMLSELKALAAASAVESRVHFVGYLGGGDKSCAYHAAELVAVPSRQEAMSIVVLEAGCAGKPVLITDQCGFEEVVPAGGGWVVPATVEGLRSGLVATLNDQNSLAEHGRMLQRMVLDRFQWATVVNQYLSLYDQVLRDHQSTGPIAARCL
jgi:glycosyltransferase involved in cell wall biosynthesis